MVNSEMLKERIKLKGMTETYIAEHMGISVGALSMKLRNKRPMLIEEVEELRNILDIRDQELEKCFFAPADESPGGHSKSSTAEATDRKSRTSQRSQSRQGAQLIN